MSLGVTVHLGLLVIHRIDGFWIMIRHLLLTVKDSFRNMVVRDLLICVPSIFPLLPSFPLTLKIFVILEFLLGFSGRCSDRG